MKTQESKICQDHVVCQRNRCGCYPPTLAGAKMAGYPLTSSGYNSTSTSNPPRISYTPGVISGGGVDFFAQVSEVVASEVDT